MVRRLFSMNLCAWTLALKTFLPLIILSVVGGFPLSLPSADACGTRLYWYGVPR